MPGRATNYRGGQLGSRAYLLEVANAYHQDGLIPTFGLRDTDLVNLEQEILDLWVSIKANQANKHGLILQDWCKDVKMNFIIMNELMYKLKGYQVLCMDADWMPYIDAAWKELADSMFKLHSCHHVEHLDCRQQGHRWPPMIDKSGK